MKRLIFIFLLIPIILSGQSIDLSGGDYKINATNIEINGETNVVGVLKLQGSAGTDGQALLSAGGGNTVWGTVTVSSSLQVKDPVACASTANLTLSGEQTIDGVETSTSRVLAKDQTDSEDNGIYVTAAGAWSRAGDAATWDTLAGAYVAVSAGTVNAGAGYFCTITDGVLGTDAVTWSQFTIPQSLIAGDGLGTSGNTWSVNVDDATIEINSDNVRAKTAAVTNGSTALATGDQIYDHVNSVFVGNFADAKWMAYGDSYTANANYYLNYADSMGGFASVVNRATSGWTIINIVGRLNSDLSDPNYLDDVDIMTLQFGLNDMSSNLTLGTKDDTVMQASVAGYMKYFIETVGTTNGAIRLFVVTPVIAWPIDETNDNGWTLYDIAVLMNDISYMYGIPVVDWFGKSGINQQTEPVMLTLNHPNSYSEPVLATMVVKAFVKSGFAGM